MKPANHKKNKPQLVLFIEDEVELVNIYRDFLENSGYVFLNSKDIKEALAITESRRPDVVLLDIIIPKPEDTMAEQGWDYLREVKKNGQTKAIPVIVFTNLDTREDRIKSRQLGAAAYIFKRDCHPGEVLEVIKKIIDKNSSSAED